MLIAMLTPRRAAIRPAVAIFRLVLKKPYDSVAFEGLLEALPK